MSWLSRLRSRENSSTTPPAATAQEGGEVRPPWVEYPGIPPWDFFWREAGENWRTLTWEPFYNSLSEQEQAEYLSRWKVPTDWYEAYFDKATRDFWEHVDDPDDSPG